MTDMSAPGPPRPEAVDTDSTTPSARTSEPSALPVVPPAPDPLRRSRTSTVWIGVIVFAVVLVVLLIFVLQNTQPVEVSFLGFSGTVSLAVAMLLAAVAGVLLAAIAGSLRIWQLRRRVPHAARH